MPATTSTSIVCKNCDAIINGPPAINPIGEYYCSNCMAGKCFTCDSCHNPTFIHDCVIVQTACPRPNDAVCPACAARLTSRCSCGAYVYGSEAFSIGDRDEICCHECFDSHYIACGGCDNVVLIEDATEDGEWFYCSNCIETHTDFSPGYFTNVRGFDEIGSRRCYGIELETMSCSEYVQELDSHPAWGAKDDCTVTGKEFYSAILSGDSGLEAVRDLADTATANGWTVDHHAGFHLHLDMRSESEDGLWAIAHAYRRTQDVWFSFVEADRHDNEYAHEMAWNCTDLDRCKHERSFADHAYRSERSDWANLSAYGAHKTIEIRLHHGTVDAEDVINWIKAHTRFVDWASRLGYRGVRKALGGLTDDELFTFIAKEIWDDSDLTIYYDERAQTYRHGFLTESIGDKV